MGITLGCLAWGGVFLRAGLGGFITSTAVAERLPGALQRLHDSRKVRRGQAARDRGAGPALGCLRAGGQPSPGPPLLPSCLWGSGQALSAL